MNYTKGDWKAGSTRGMDSLYHNFVQSVDKPDLFPLARVSGINEEEVLANAHLIAAAPDMYEALKAVDDYLSAPYPENMKLKQVAANKLVKALAKAEEKEV